MNRRRQPRRSERHISVRGVRRDPPDLRKLSRALLAIAQAEAEAQAQAQADKDETARQSEQRDAEQ